MIRARTQGMGATNFLNRLTELVEEEHANAGLDPNDVVRAAPKLVNRDGDPMAAILTQALLKQPLLVFGAPPVLPRY
ncbi:MAG: hypothetical protein EXR05_00075 [Acetobacteraceae bacterium]|nr:hypothetical protein [Acetobacteraceae bacterium]